MRGLLQHGFDAFPRNNNNLTPEDLARQSNNTSKAFLLKQFCTLWGSLIRPTLIKAMSSDEYTALPMDLVDLALQYIDGHGQPFASNEKKRKRSLSSEPDSRSEAIQQKRDDGAAAASSSGS
jgi:hypothetical protein